MNEVREYHSSEDFGKGLDEMSGKGWTLHSWHMVTRRYDGHDHIVIVAVFRGRRA